MRILEPTRDGAVLEAAAGLAMARVVESHEAPALRGRPGVERLGLGGAHVGAEAAEPHDRRSAAVADEHGDPARVGGGADIEELRHWLTVPKSLARDPRACDS
jgi:hypothetical protein